MVHVSLMLLKWGLFDSLCSWFCRLSLAQTEVIGCFNDSRNLWYNIIINLTDDDDSEAG